MKPDSQKRIGLRSQVSKSQGTKNPKRIKIPKAQRPTTRKKRQDDCRSSTCSRDQPSTGSDRADRRARLELGH